MKFELCNIVPSDWSLLPLESVCKKVTSGGTPSRRNSAFYENGTIPWVKTKELGKCWIEDAEEYITEEALQNSSAKILPANTLLMAMYGATVGELGLLRKEMACNQACCAMIVDEEKNDPRYLFYLLSSQKAFIKSLATGAAQQNLSAAQIKKFLLPFPPVYEQRRIADILSALDDKIELNRRMNQTLEAIARALFKSWFVDFDPVRAKAEDCDTGLPKHIADLFPDRFVDSKLGEIPEGWGIKSLDTIANFLNGLAMQKFPPVNGEPTLPVIKIAQIKKGDTSGADLASSKLDPKYVVNDGDLIFSWSGSLEVKVWSGGKGALNQHLFKVTSEKYPQWLCHFWVHKHLEEFRRIAADKAVTMGHIKRSHLSQAICAIPPRLAVAKLNQIFEPLANQNLLLSLQSRRLASIRDSLLPRLLSGELSAMEAA